MEVAQDCKTSGALQRRRPGLYLEYFIDCPPCPRKERRRLELTGQLQAADHRRHRAGSSSTADDPLSPRSLPVTPTTEVACPIVENGERQLGEFQRRTSSFRRGHRRPASATPVMSEVEPLLTVIKPRPLKADGQVCHQNLRCKCVEVKNIKYIKT